jgi:hypothetical protein
MYTLPSGDSPLVIDWVNTASTRQDLSKKKPKCGFDKTDVGMCQKTTTKFHVHASTKNKVLFKTRGGPACPPTKAFFFGGGAEPFQSHFH